jgi:hypothetical protein
LRAGGPADQIPLWNKFKLWGKSPKEATIKALGAEHGFSVDSTEDATRFTDAGLARYQVVVFLSTTGDISTMARRVLLNATFGPRVRRHPLGERHRVSVGLVWAARRRLFREPPPRFSRRRSRSKIPPIRRRGTCRWSGSAPTNGTISAATPAAPYTSWQRSTRRAIPAARWAPTIRSRGVR